MHKENTYPLISVVVPAYNAETRIAGTLEAIIAQDYPNLEVIVVNDASKDKTEQAARRVLESCGRPFSVISHKKTAAYQPLPGPHGRRYPDRLYLSGNALSARIKNLADYFRLRRG